jgi:hypothetical protein
MTDREHAAAVRDAARQLAAAAAAAGEAGLSVYVEVETTPAFGRTASATRTHRSVTRQIDPEGR